MWDLPGPGLEPVSPALAGGFLTTVPPGKSLETCLSREIYWILVGTMGVCGILARGCSSPSPPTRPIAGKSGPAWRAGGPWQRGPASSGAESGKFHAQGVAINNKLCGNWQRRPTPQLAWGPCSGRGKRRTTQTDRHFMWTSGGWESQGGPWKTPCVPGGLADGTHAQERAEKPWRPLTTRRTWIPFPKGYSVLPTPSLKILSLPRDLWPTLVIHELSTQPGPLRGPSPLRHQHRAALIRSQRLSGVVTSAESSQFLFFRALLAFPTPLLFHKNCITNSFHSINVSWYLDWGCIEFIN